MLQFACSLTYIPLTLTLSLREREQLVLCLLNGWCFVAPSLACGEARGGSIPRSGAVTDEQRSHRPNWAQPKGRQSFSLQASLLTPCRSNSDMLVARASPGPKNPCRKTPAI